MSVSRSEISVPVGAASPRALASGTFAVLLAGALGLAAPVALASAAELLLAQGEAESMDDLFGADEPEESASPAQQSAPPPAQQKE